MLKKKFGYGKRFYREWINAKELQAVDIIQDQSDIHIRCDIALDKKLLEQRTRLYRRQINQYISEDKKFLTSLLPLRVSSSAAPIVKEMASVSRLVNVGPMATVAGAIAQYLANDILKQGAQELIVENGGDIFLKTRKIRQVSIYAADSKLSNKIFLKIYPQDTPLGVCTSSGTVGHSLSLGKADAVTILASNAIICDAVATAACNLIKSENDIKKAIEFAKRVKEVRGIVIIFKNKLASWGKIEFV